MTAVVAKLDGGRTKKRVLDDIAKRVESLKQAIANNSLSATVRTLVGDLVAALSEEQYDIVRSITNVISPCVTRGGACVRACVRACVISTMCFQESSMIFLSLNYLGNLPFSFRSFFYKKKYFVYIKYIYTLTCCDFG